MTITAFLPLAFPLLDALAGAGGTNEFTSFVPQPARFPASFLRARNESTS